MTDVAIVIESSIPKIIIDHDIYPDDFKIFIPDHSPCENLNTMAPKCGQLNFSWPCSKRSSPVCQDFIQEKSSKPKLK